ncbi:MAG: phospholipase [Gammaproteobacteria bacterium]|nr:phospholipase [Gammaproteobacteria bacterium]
MADTNLDALTNAITQALPTLLKSIEALEIAQRHLHPPRFETLAASLEPVKHELDSAVEPLGEVTWPDDLQVVQSQLGSAASYVSQALKLATTARTEEHFVQWIRATRARIRGTEMLYPLSPMFSPVNRFFIEAGCRNNDAIVQRAGQSMRSAPEEPQVGVMHAQNGRDERGGFSLYVPEFYTPDQQWPLVVALHGGSGHGADFLWTWLREARSRGFIVLAPTAREGTWSLMGNDVDSLSLKKMVEYVSDQWRIDSARILLTGMSDGATYSLLTGLQPDMPYTAFAPISGVLHPMNEVNGNMSRARGKPIYLVHGAFDWMFPVETAQIAHEELKAVGANVHYREIEDLSHTYPREENAAIAAWFDESLRVEAT